MQVPAPNPDIEDLPLLHAAVMWRLRAAVSQQKGSAPQATYDAIAECLQLLDQLAACRPQACQGSLCSTNGSTAVAPASRSKAAATVMGQPLLLCASSSSTGPGGTAAPGRNTRA